MDAQPSTAMLRAIVWQAWVARVARPTLRLSQLGAHVWGMLLRGPLCRTFPGLAWLPFAEKNS